MINLGLMRPLSCEYFYACCVQCRLHELANKKRISVTGASKLLANTLYSYKGMGLSMVSHSTPAAIPPSLLLPRGTSPQTVGNGLLLLSVWRFRVISLVLLPAGVATSCWPARACC
jgi:hypothetical protein